MKTESHPTPGFYTVKSRAKETFGQKAGMWGISYTLPVSFPHEFLTAGGKTWKRGRFERLDMFAGDDTLANKKKAERDAHDIIDAIVKARDAVLADPNPSAEPLFTWNDAWRDYATVYSAEKPNGRGQTKMFFTRWQCIAPFIGDFPLRDLDGKGKPTNRVRAYLEGLLPDAENPSPRMFRGRNGRPDYATSKTMTRASMEGYQTLLKAVARSAHERGLIDFTDIPVFQFFAESNKREGVWTWEQMQALWDAAPGWDGPGSYLHRFVWILLSSGQRRGRIEHLKWENLENDLEQPWASSGGPGKARESYFAFAKAYENTAVRRKKNKVAARQIISNPELLDLLAWCFENREPGNPYVLGRLKTANAEFGDFVRTVAAARPELGIPVLSPHHARHSLATHLLGEEGRSTASVAAFLGCTISILERHYAHLTALHAVRIAAIVSERLTSGRSKPKLPLAAE